MAKLQLLAGTTSKLIDVFIQDTSVTTGAGLTGLTNGSGSLTWYYYREGAASAVQVTAIASMTLGTWVTKGFIVVDGTNMPGVYQLGVPDAALAAGAKSVVMMLKGATNMAPVVLEIELTAVDNQNATSFGLSDLDAAISTRLAASSYTAPSNLTAAQIATGVWQDTTSGDFTVSSSIGKSLYTSGNAPGAASGIALVGSNMGSITGALTAAQIATGVWQDATAGDFTAANSIGKSVMNGVALGTGLTVNDLTTKTGFSLSQSFPTNFSALGIGVGGHITTVDTVTTVTNQLTAAAIATGVWTDTTAGDFTTSLSIGKSIMNGVTLGTGLTVAAVSGNVTFGNTSIGTVTNLTNLPSIPANWLTATGIAASALNGKGDWNIGKTGYSISGTITTLDSLATHGDSAWATATGFATPTNITAGTITTVTNLTNAPTAGDFTAAMKTSLDAATPAVTVSDKTGFSLTQAFPSNFAALGIGVGGHILAVDTLTTYTGNTPQTGDVYARVGAAGAGLTALGDARIAHLDADVSSRSTYAGADTSGTTTLLARLTSTRAGLLDNLDAAVSTRSTFSGGAVASVTGAVGSVAGSVGSVSGLTASDVGAIKTVTDGLPTFVHTGGKLWALDGAGNAIAPASQTQVIQNKTDSLTFTNSDELDVNVHSVNDVRLTGTGIETTDEWRPA